MIVLIVMIATQSYLQTEIEEKEVKVKRSKEKILSALRAAVQT